MSVTIPLWPIALLLGFAWYWLFVYLFVQDERHGEWGQPAGSAFMLATLTYIAFGFLAVVLVW